MRRMASLKQAQLIQDCLNFFEATQPFRHLHCLLSQSDLYGREVYFLVKYHPTLLTNIENIVTSHFEGPIPLFRTSNLNLSLLFSMARDPPQNIFKICSNIRAHNQAVMSAFQFPNFRYSPFLKYWLTSTLILAIAIAIQSMSAIVQSKYESVFPYSENPTPNQVRDAKMLFQIEGGAFLVTMPLTMSISLQSITNILLSKITNSKESLPLCEIMIHILLVLVMVLTYSYFSLDHLTFTDKSEL